MADEVRDVLKPLAKTAPGFKASMNGQWHKRKDEIRDPQNLNMWLDVNGEKRQRGNTKTMIFDCEHLVWYCSQFFVMEPGDIIITGTRGKRSSAT